MVSINMSETSTATAPRRDPEAFERNLDQPLTETSVDPNQTQEQPTIFVDPSELAWGLSPYPASWEDSDPTILSYGPDGEPIRAPSEATLNHARDEIQHALDLESRLDIYRRAHNTDPLGTALLLDDIVRLEKDGLTPEAQAKIEALAMASAHDASQAALENVHTHQHRPEVVFESFAVAVDVIKTPAKHQQALNELEQTAKALETTEPDAALVLQAIEDHRNAPETGVSVCLEARNGLAEMDRKIEAGDRAIEAMAKALAEEKHRRAELASHIPDHTPHQRAKRAVLRSAGQLLSRMSSRS